MLDSCERILRCTEGLSFERFADENVIFDAVVRRLQVIGEAATQVPYEIRDRYQEIEWRKIVGLRNIVVHQYASVDEEILWDIVPNNVPELHSKLHRILASLETDDE